MKVSGHILDQPETDLHFVTFSRFAVGGCGGQKTLIAGLGSKSSGCGKYESGLSQSMQMMKETLAPASPLWHAGSNLTDSLLLKMNSTR